MVNGWRVPTDELQKWREYVEAEYGETDADERYAARRAIEEYIGNDGFESAERALDGEIDDPAYSSEAERDKKCAGWNPEDLKTGSTEQVWISLPDHVTEAFDKHLEKVYSDVNLGLGLAMAFRRQRDRSRADRIESKAERVASENETLRTAVGDDEPEEMSTRQRRAAKIAAQLGKQFRHGDLVETIERVAGPSVVDWYIDEVLERKDAVKHPGHRDRQGLAEESVVYVPRDEALAYMQDDEIVDESTAAHDITHMATENSEVSRALATDGGGGDQDS